MPDEGPATPEQADYDPIFGSDERPAHHDYYQVRAAALLRSHEPLQKRPHEEDPYERNPRQRREENRY